MTKLEFETLVNIAGVPGSHRMGKSPNTVTPIDKIGIQSVGKAEEQLINSYGVDAKKIHIKASSLPVAPEKFDVILIGTQRHVLEAVLEKLETGSGLLIGWMGYAKGN